MDAYENTLEGTMKSSGICQICIKDFPGIILPNDRASVKNDLLEEIYMENACYLLCVDDLLEEMHSRRAVRHGYF